MMQCCVAANAPWPSPPKASEHCFVVSISTKRRLCGIALQILHKSHDDDVSLPLPLARVTGLTKEDYDSKMQQLEMRLAQWKGGYADAFWTAWAFLVILLFVVGYMVPSFWIITGFQENPFWILLLMSSQLCGFYMLWRTIAYENRTLVHQIEQDMRLWHGIRVSVQRVAHLPATTRSGMYCFCVAMQSHAASGDEEATIAVSEYDDDDSEEEESSV